MQAQHRNTPINGQRAHFIKPSARAIAKQASLNKFDIVPRTDAEQADIQDQGFSVAPTSAPGTSQKEPMGHQSAQPAQPQADSYILESNNSDSPAAIQQRVPDATEDACNVASKQFNAATVIPQFEIDLAEIAKLGKKTSDAINDYHGKIQKAAIESLGKCLGFRQKYFKIDDLGITDKLYAALYKKAIGKEFKKKAKNTTEYHLISRVFRGDDRRRASSDAQILTRANREGITEQTFSDWVLKENGLDAIKRKEAEERKNNNPGKVKKVSKRQCSERFVAALKGMRMGGLIRNVNLIEENELSALVGKWTISDREKYTPIIIHPQEDGKFRISRFYLHLDDSQFPVYSDSL